MLVSAHCLKKLKFFFLFLGVRYSYKLFRMGPPDKQCFCLLKQPKTFPSSFNESYILESDIL